MKGTSNKGARSSAILHRLWKGACPNPARRGTVMNEQDSAVYPRNHSGFALMVSDHVHVLHNARLPTPV